MLTLRASPHPALIAEYDPWQHEVGSGKTTAFRSLLRDMGFRLKSVIDEANGTVIDAAEATDPLPNHRAINLWYERD